jgi:CRP-like cAMP-binding protein
MFGFHELATSATRMIAPLVGASMLDDLIAEETDLCRSLTAGDIAGGDLVGCIESIATAWVVAGRPVDAALLRAACGIHLAPQSRGIQLMEAAGDILGTCDVRHELVAIRAGLVTHRPMVQTPRLFAHVDMREVNAMSRHLTRAPLRVGDMSGASWRSSNALYIIDRGRVQLSRILDDGRALPLAILGHGAVLGESVSFGREPGDLRVDVIEEGNALVVYATELPLVISMVPVAGAALVSVAGDCTSSHSLTMEWSHRRRIAHALLELSRHHAGPAPSQGGPVGASVNRPGVCRMSGCSTAIVEDVLAELELAGAVAVQGEWIAVVRFSALEAIVADIDPGGSDLPTRILPAA